MTWSIKWPFIGGAKYVLNSICPESAIGGLASFIFVNKQSVTKQHNLPDAQIEVPRSNSPRKADIRNRNQLFVDTKKYLHVEQRRSVTVLEIESFHLNITENKYLIASRCPPVSVLGSRSNFASDRWLIVSNISSQWSFQSSVSVSGLHVV